MSRIKHQRREHTLAARHDPSLLPRLPRWRGPSHPPASELAVEEAAARSLRPRSLGRRVTQLFRWADLHAPSLVTSTSRRSFRLLAELPWLRALDQVGTVPDLRALAEALLCRYPVSPALLATFDATGWERPDEDGRRFARVAACLGRGGGFAEVDRLLDGTLTRGVFASLLVSRVESPILALRTAQVERHKGPPWLAPALAQHHSFATIRAPLYLLPWLCRHAEPEDLGHVLDWVRTQPPTVLEGRTWASVRRLAAEWRAPRPPPIADTRPFSPSGLSEGLPPDLDTWRIRELLSPLELYVDGNVMRHCVATYAAHVRSGLSSIWSLRRGDRRVLTLEVRNATRQVVQVRGVCNRRPDHWEKVVVGLWAASNGLTVLEAAV